MLTKNQLAKKSGIPTSSLKYYMEQYPEFFEPHHVVGRAYPTYKEEHIQVAITIRQLIQERKDPDEVRAELQEKGFDPVYDYMESTSLDRQVVNNSQTFDDLDTLPSFQASLEAVKALNRMTDELRVVIEKQESDIENRDQTIEDQNITIEELQAQIAEQKKTIEALEDKSAKKK